jgi:2-polyprenyl-6-hydroxyphenyl methylase/3-demethylubiquinone-9 3-methyltransferase
MIGVEKIIDYGYGPETSTTCAHAYLLKALEKLLSRLPITPDAQILDAGCGGGNVISWFYQKGYLNIWGVDVSQSGIMLAKKQFPHLHSRLEIHNVYEKQLPAAFPFQQYDMIVSLEVIEHLFSPKTFLENIAFWLKKDGYLIVSTPYHGYWKNLAIALCNGHDKHFYPLWEGGHIKFFSRKTLFQMLEQSGLRPLQFWGSGRLPYLWKSMIVVAQKV